MRQFSPKDAIQLAQHFIADQLGVLTVLLPFAANEAHARILAGNALLAAGVFLQAHGMSTMRTAEIQFLGHVRNAILHGGTFAIEKGELPLASFAGRVIDASLNGMTVFDDGDRRGLLAPADAVALLCWVQSYLHQTQERVTGGDAG